MGKVDSRKLHRCGKVPITESAKYNIGVLTIKTVHKIPSCSICKQTGHNANGCKMPVETKRCVVDLGEFDMHVVRLANDANIKPNKSRRSLDFVPINDWI